MRAESVIDIPLEDVRPMPSQVRTYFDPVALNTLALSIIKIGQTVPATVYRLPPQHNKSHAYELIDGERRLRACRIAGKPTLRAVVIDEPDEEKRYIISGATNLGRAGHDHMEIAYACDRIRRSLPLKMTGKIAEVAAMLVVSEPSVYQHLSLLNLCDELKQALHPTCPKAKRIPFTVAIKLAAFDHARQRDAYDRILKSGVSPVRAAERAIGESAGDDGEDDPVDAPPGVAAGRAGPGRDKDGNIRAQGPCGGRRRRVRSPYEQWRDFVRLAARSAHDIEGFRPEWLGDAVRGRPSEERQTAFAALGRLIKHAEKLDAVLRAAGAAHGTA